MIYHHSKTMKPKFPLPIRPRWEALIHSSNQLNTLRISRGERSDSRVMMYFIKTFYVILYHQYTAWVIFLWVQRIQNIFCRTNFCLLFSSIELKKYFWVLGYVASDNPKTTIEKCLYVPSFTYAGFEAFLVVTLPSTARRSFAFHCSSNLKLRWAWSPAR